MPRLHPGPHIRRVRHRCLGTVLLAASSVMLVGCGDASSGSPGGDVGLDAPDHPLELVPEARYQVGGFDAPEWAMFGNIISVSFDDRGHLFVLDSQANTVTEVDARGGFVRTIGRTGEGPGELSGAQAVAVTGDGEVAVFDLGHQAWVVYDASGQFVRNVRVDVTELGFPRGDVATHPDGGVVAPMSGRILMADTPGLSTRPVPWYSLESPDASRVLYEGWTLPAVESGSRSRLDLEGGGQIQFAMPVLRAFEPPLSTAVLPDGRVAVVDSVGYRIKVVALDGTVTEVLERPVAPVPVTPRIEEAEKQRRAEAMAGSGGGGQRTTISVIGGAAGGTASGGGGGVALSGGAIGPAQVRQLRENQLASMVFAPEIPAIEAIAVDGHGRVWVQRSSGVPGEPGPTDLITPDGRYLGTVPPDGVRIPRAFGPEGLMVREVTDEYDVQTLIVEWLPAEAG